ncbi:MAG: riboflavin synthase [Eubacteriaceae bacterium]|jgi:riboflavin synthase|nr:riboflavin synthase [Eubacteriaceae bacterium]
MFTGIVEEVGSLVRALPTDQGGQLTIAAKKVLQDVALGDSIAVNGTCLTLVAHDGQSFVADVMGETLRQTNLGDLKVGEAVNLERAMAADGRFGGHMVSGHIDGMGHIIAIEKEQNARWLTITASPALLAEMIPRGSITVDGISLTIARLEAESFKVSMIPHTLIQTQMQYKKVGDRVNLETDLIGKYVRRALMRSGQEEQTSNITLEDLIENGF